MKKNVMLLAIGAALMATPALAHSGGGKNAPTGDVTRAQAEAQAIERFTKLDVNKDGKYDATDRAARAEQRATKASNNSSGNAAARDGERRGDRAESNKSVTQAEFVAKALKRFDDMDTNKDGVVTAAERQAARDAKAASRTKN